MERRGILRPPLLSIAIMREYILKLRFRGTARITLSCLGPDPSSRQNSHVFRKMSSRTPQNGKNNIFL